MSICGGGLRSLPDLFVLLPGQRHDSVGVAPLLSGLEFGALLGNKGFDVDWLCAKLDARSAIAVIPTEASRKAIIPCEQAMYRWRDLIKKYFAKLKEFRAVAIHYDETDDHLRATINLAAAVVASRQDVNVP
ncbi:hypothetical protein [Belnapia moabensis]|uniref:hypothetical protein n=1 Tax=Belnapia moabensis TaxID=365533 RepID=UPI0005BE6390|nr:hypothetical protein [Belnapia moabensis]